MKTQVPTQQVEIAFTLLQLHIVLRSFFVLKHGPMQVRFRPVAPPSKKVEVGELHRSLSDYWRDTVNFRKPSGLPEADFRSWQSGIDLKLSLSIQQLDIVIGTLQSSLCGCTELKLLIGAEEEVAETLELLLVVRQESYRYQ
jgi:hypothetical protein